jgi:hypothetical protein
VYQRHKDLKASSGMQFAANPKSSAVFNAALEAAKAKASGALFTWFLYSQFSALRSGCRCYQ